MCLKVRIYSGRAKRERGRERCKTSRKVVIDYLWQMKMTVRRNGVFLFRVLDVVVLSRLDVAICFPTYDARRDTRLASTEIGRAKRQST